jgi:NAD(P)-dependent dehydrogenase (short-subunit alcohol dehydrogenase family)
VRREESRLERGAAGTPAITIGFTARVGVSGAIATDFNGGRLRDTPEFQRLVSQMTALGRPGVPDDIGPMIASLLSDDHRWVNGQRIEASGGMFV